MKVFVAGATGALGRFLVPHMAEAGHQVVALARGPEKARALQAMGAQAVLADALDKDGLTAAILEAEPEVIVHQLTAIAGVTNLKKFDQEFALTNRLRTEVTDTLLAAGRLLGTRRFFCDGKQDEGAYPEDVFRLREEVGRAQGIILGTRSDQKGVRKWRSVSTTR